MLKKIINELLSPRKEDPEEKIEELLYDKKRKLYINFSLMAIYTVLLIATLFII